MFSFLQELVDGAGRSSHLIRQWRVKLVCIKDFWVVLHGFIKPATDAHTLQIPVALLDLLGDELRTLAGLGDARFVTLQSADFNYLQFPHGGLQDLARPLQSILGAPPFPSRLGVIAIPYSQPGSLFTNILICHELGHFVFQELSKDAELSAEVNRSIRATFGELDPAIRSLFRKQLMSWAVEMYCDLFAVGLIGPAFSLASIEVFNLLGVLERPKALTFKDRHPAEACRFKEQWAQLNEAGWWPYVQNLTSQHVTLIEDLAGIKEEDYRFDFRGIPGVGLKLVEAFLGVRPTIRRLVTETLGDRRGRLKDFQSWNKEIQICLREGVVPSAINAAGTAEGPSSVALINSSFCFYLESVADLTARVGYDAAKVAKRCEVAGRVEMWTMKALEDIRLLRGARGVA